MDGGKQGGGDPCGEAIGESGKRQELDSGTGFKF